VREEVRVVVATVAAMVAAVMVAVVMAAETAAVREVVMAVAEAVVMEAVEMEVAAMEVVAILEAVMEQHNRTAGEGDPSSLQTGSCGLCRPCQEYPSACTAPQMMTRSQM